MMREHAILSASGADRWMLCNPSARLEEELAGTTSIFAEEGTFMHSLAELHLGLHISSITKRDFNSKLKEMKKNKFYTDEIEKAVEAYVNMVIERINESGKGALVLLEERVDFSPWVPEGFGTSDVLIISDETIEVIDLKGGKGIKVSSEDNSQMKLYALGAINLYGMLYEVEKIKMTIIQPRLDNISIAEMEIEELIEWAETEVKPNAERAYKGEGEFYPSYNSCLFCRAKAICRSRADENTKIACLDFRPAPTLTDEEIVEVLLQVDELIKWAKDVEKFAYTEAVNNGKEWPGFKLVEGRRTRRYSSEEKVAERLLEAGYEEKKIFSKSLLSLTKLEKELGKDEFEEILKDLIERPPGNPKLVPDEDKRIEIKNTAEIDFKEEI